MSRSGLARLQPFVRLSAFTACCILVLTAGALAQDQTPKAPKEPAATRIEVDERANIIRFFIGGVETMQLDARGLHVREDMSYGGMLHDYGDVGFDGHVGESGEGRDAR